MTAIAITQIASIMQLLLPLMAHQLVQKYAIAQAATKVGLILVQGWWHCGIRKMLLGCQTQAHIFFEQL
jgi:hypothetical protein